MFRRFTLIFFTLLKVITFFYIFQDIGPKAIEADKIFYKSANAYMS